MRGKESPKGLIIGNEPTAIAEAKEQVLLSSWQRQIEERQSGGYSIDEWCRMQGISKSSYYYRLRRVRAHLSKISGVMPEQEIVALRDIPNAHTHAAPAASDVSEIEISRGDVKVSFKGTVRAELLQVVLEALK